MKETKAQKDYYDLVERVEQFNEEAAELLYFDVIFERNFRFSGCLGVCFAWADHYKGRDYWADINWELRDDISV